MSDRRRRPGIVGPVILIGLGIVFLLNNMGLLAWSVWEVLLRMWPVLIIALGLDLLIGRRSAWGSLVAVLLVLALFATAFWLFGLDTETGQLLAGEQVSQSLGGATRAKVEIGQGAGVQRIGALPESANLVEGRIQRARGEDVKHDFEAVGSSASFELASQGVVWFSPIGRRGPTWDLELNPDVLLELEISLGAGDSDLDLSDLKVSDLNVSLGVGQLTVVLPQRGEFRADINSAIGQTVVIIPAGMEARIDLSAALVARNLPSDYQRRGDAYVSPGYDTAENLVDLEVSQAIGQVTIRHSGE